MGIIKKITKSGKDIICIEVNRFIETPEDFDKFQEELKDGYRKYKNK